MTEYFTTGGELGPFFCGLAFLLVATALEQQRNADRSLAWDCLLSSALLQGICEWFGVLSRSPSEPPALFGARVAMGVAAGVLLLEFGRRGIPRLAGPAGGRVLHCVCLAAVGLASLAGSRGVIAACGIAWCLPGGVLAAVNLSRREWDDVEGTGIWRRCIAVLAIATYAVATSAVAILTSTPSWLPMLDESSLSMAESSLQILRGACVLSLYFCLSASASHPRSREAGGGRRWILPALCATLVVLGLLNAQWRSRMADSRQRETLQMQATGMARTLNPNAAKALTFTAKDRRAPAFERLRRQMIELNRLTSARGIYTLAERNGQLVFGPESYAEGDPQASLPGTIYQYPTSVDWAVFRTRKAATVGPETDEYGTFVSALAPVLDPVTGDVIMAVGLDLEARDWASIVRSARVLPMAGTMVLLLLVLALKSGVQRRALLPAKRQVQLRHLETGYAAVLGVVLSCAAIEFIYGAEQHSRWTGFSRTVTLQSELLFNQFHAIRHDLSAMAKFFESSDDVTERDFEHFSLPMVNSGSGRAYAWFDARRLTDGTVHTEVRFVEPATEAKRLKESELNQDAAAHAAILEAVATGLPTAIEPPSERKLPAKSRAMLVFQPVYSRPLNPDSSAAVPVGLALVRIDLQRLIDRLRFESIRDDGSVDLDLLDSRSDVSNPIAVAEWMDGGRPSSRQSPVRVRGLGTIIPVLAFGRTFGVGANPSKTYLTANPSQATRFAVLGCTVFTVVLTVLIGVVRNRHVALEREVRIHTQQLRDREQELSATLQVVAENERKLRTVCDTTLNGVVMMDDQGRAVFWNNAAEKIFGYTASEAIGRPFPTLLATPDQQQKFEEQFAHLVNSGGGLVGKIVELTAIRKNRSILPIEMALSAVNKDGQWQAVGIISDITERRIAERDREREQERTRTLLALGQMTNVSVDHCLQWAIEACTRLTGSDFGYLALLSDDETSLTIKGWSSHAMRQCRMDEKPLDYQVQHTGLWGEAIRQRRAIITNDYASPNPRKKGLPDGHIPLTRHMNLPVFDGDRIVAVAGVANKPIDYDDTDVQQLRLLMEGVWSIVRRKQAEDAERAQAASLRAANAELETHRRELTTAYQQLSHYTNALESANQTLEETSQVAQSATRAKSEFLANMSHEIRTPITAILGFADIMVEENYHRTTQEHAAIIKRNAEHLLGLVNDILDLSKVEAGKLSVEQTQSAPSQVLEEAVTLMRVRADDKQIALDTVIEPSTPPIISTDPLRLRQVLVNLLGNAIKFTENGSVCITARGAKVGETRSLQIDVRDTGIGMDSEQISRLFQPFTQVDASAARRFGGSGLGLAISRRLVELLGGKITVQSTPGEGSTFTLCLPVGQVPAIAEEPRPPSPIAESRGNEESSAVGRILVVDDGADNRRLVTFLLRRAGLEVNAVENGQLAFDEAISAWRQARPYDLILMDMQMPVMDGYTATAQLRVAGYTAPIVALTAHALAEDRNRCLEAGCNDYATKPFDPKQLVALAQRYCRPAPTSGVLTTLSAISDSAASLAAV